MKYELFDPARHKVEKREIALAFDRDGVREVSLADTKARFPGAEYPCAMRSLMVGEHDIGWGEKLRVMPEDVAMCVVNGNATIRDHFFPLLFDHGFTGRGTESPGDVLECYEENGAFWQLCDLADDDIYRDACKPGKRWKSRSLGFGAWIDGDGFLRPVQPRELSLTNLPRLKGLGKVVEMSHLRQAFGIGFGPGPAGLSVPISLAAVPSAPPEGAENAATGGEASLSTPIPSPDPASNRKEERMFKVPPKLQKLLGRVEFASEDDFNQAVEALEGDVALGEKPQPAKTAPETPAPTATPAPTVSLADVEKLVADATQKTFAALAEANARAQAEIAAAATRKARVDAVIEKGIRMGRIRKPDAELYRPAVEANPDAFEAHLAAMPKVAPVDPVYEPGSFYAGLGSGRGSGEFYGFDSPRDYSREIADTVASLGCSVSQAIQIVNAGGLPAAKEN